MRPRSSSARNWVADFEEALAAANGVEFGLSASLYTRDANTAMKFVERAEVGAEFFTQLKTVFFDYTGQARTSKIY